MPRSVRKKKGKRASRMIFVSHASLDTWTAKRIAEKIGECGAKTFLDEAHVDTGDDFEERIREALDQADELLVLITPWALKRPFVWVEIGVAWSRRIPIISVLYGLNAEEFLEQADIPVFLKKRDFIDINHLDDYFMQLEKRVNLIKSL